VDDHDLSSLRLVLSTAAPLSAGLEAELADRLGCTVGQGYAMTEGIPFTISRSDAPGYRPGSVGPAAPNTELRLVDPATGADAPPGAPGELWVRGPQLMAGYAGDPEATAATLAPQGWLRTGDLCSIDRHGNVTVHDRLKELIKVSGMQVPPAELEGILLSHPDVKDCAVVPRPHEKTGQVPVAYVVATPRLDVASVRACVAERVPPYKRLADIVVVDQLPRNPTGKLLRRMLAESERERHPAGQSA
jgi:acyl-CoA synthetase (AMP-forming)/AMP-acid ligase II